MSEVWAGYDLPPLRFAADALAPVLQADALRVHHEVIHRAYVDRLNEILRPHVAWHGRTIEDLLRNLRGMPPDLRALVADLGGGHANHQFFWKVIGPHGRDMPQGALASAIDRAFGSFDAFRASFEDAADRVPASGWAFLVADPARSFALEVLALADNASVLPLGRMGLLVCDLWEHAWLRDFAGDRRAWLRRWWDIVDWAVVEQRYELFREGARRA